jgi:hypothetical protein
MSETIKIAIVSQVNMQDHRDEAFFTNKTGRKMNPKKRENPRDRSLSQQNHSRYAHKQGIRNKKAAG